MFLLIDLESDRKVLVCGFVPSFFCFFLIASSHIRSFCECYRNSLSQECDVEGRIVNKTVFFFLVNFFFVHVQPQFILQGKVFCFGC